MKKEALKRKREILRDERGSKSFIKYMKLMLKRS